MTPDKTQAIAKSPDAFLAFKISEADTNYFACLADPIADDAPFTMIVEIYEPGGATPPNTHAEAYEHFFILHGTGKGSCDGVTVDLAPGASLLIPPGKEHVVENTGTGKLYALTTMVPNEGFAELIHAGIPVELDAEDLAVLTGKAA